MKGIKMSHHKITLDDLIKEPPVYIILKRCFTCPDEDRPEAWPMEFPSQKAAQAYLDALIEMHKIHEQSHEFRDGVHYIVDNDGDSHEIVFAIAKHSQVGEIAWQSGDDSEQTKVNEEFNSIIGELKLDIDDTDIDIE
jgi:hypothetical protein